MGKAPDLVGQIFGRLTVVKQSQTAGGRTLWDCRCSCGNERPRVDPNNLRHGRTLSCGCFFRQRMKETFQKHGEARRTPEYLAWKTMRGRVLNPNNSRAKNYTPRGITICKAWDSYETFLQDMGRRPTPEHSLDRRNNDKGYSKANCRWATEKQQARNKTNNHFVEWKGSRRCLSEWAELVGVDQVRFRHFLLSRGKTFVFTKLGRVI